MHKIQLRQLKRNKILIIIEKNLLEVMLEKWKQVMRAYKSIDKHGIDRQITKEVNKSKQNPQSKLSYTAPWAVGQNIKGHSLIGCTIAVFTIPI